MDNIQVEEQENYTTKLLYHAMDFVGTYSDLMNGTYTMDYDRNIVKKVYSQAEFYEDIWALDRMGYKYGGVFVDIGAGDGVRKSSTFMLSTKFGWTGLLVEPLEKYLSLLYIYRQDSVIVPYCVYNETRMKEFTLIDELPKGTHLRHLYKRGKTIEGISELLRKALVNDIASKLMVADDHISRSILQCIHIQSVLEDNNLTYIDYLHIDTDGSEMAILRAIDFDKVEIAIIHMQVGGFEGRANAFNFLEPLGYEAIPLGDIISFHRSDLIETHRNRSYTYWSSGVKRFDGSGNVRSKSIYSKEYRRPSVWPRDCPLPAP